MYLTKRLLPLVAGAFGALLAITIMMPPAANAQLISLSRIFFEQEYGQEPNIVEEAFDAVYTSDHCYAIVGLNESTSSSSDGLSVVKLDQEGMQLWTQRYTEWVINRGVAIIQANDGDLVVVGFEESESLGVIIKLSNATGAIIWKRFFHLDGFDCTSLQPNANHAIRAMNLAQLDGATGDFVVVGSTIGDGPFDGDNIFLGRFGHNNGVPVWLRSYTCINDDNCTNLAQEGIDLDLQNGNIRVVGTTEYEISPTQVRSDILNLTFSNAGVYTSGVRLTLERATDPVNSFPTAMWADDQGANGEIVIVGQIQSTNLLAGPIGGFILRRSGGTWIARQLIAPNTNNNMVIATDVEKYDNSNFIISGTTDHPNQSAVAFLMRTSPSTGWGSISRTYGHSRDASAFHGLGIQPPMYSNFGDSWDQGVIGVGSWSEDFGNQTNAYIVKTSFFPEAVDQTNCPTDDGVSLDELTVDIALVDLAPFCEFDDFDDDFGHDSYINVVEECRRSDHGPYGKEGKEVQEAIVNGTLDVRVYPSQVRPGETLNLVLPEVMKGDVKLRITDLLGRELFTSTQTGDRGQVAVETLGWTAGSYMVHVHAEGALSASALVVVR